MMKTRIEFAALAAMGATPAQLDVYSNTDPLDIYKIGDDLYKVTGAIAGEYTAAGVLEILDVLAGGDEL